MNLRVAKGVRASVSLVAQSISTMEHWGINFDARSFAWGPFRWRHAHASPSLGFAVVSRVPTLRPRKLIVWSPLGGRLAGAGARWLPMGSRLSRPAAQTCA